MVWWSSGRCDAGHRHGRAREAALALLDGRRRSGAGSLWAPTKPTTWPTSWRRYGLDPVSPHVTIDGHLSKTGKPRKTSVDRPDPRATPAMRSACAAAKRIEEVFGWIKSSAGLAKIKLLWSRAGRCHTAFTMALAAYNLIRLRPGCWRRQHERAGQVAHRRDGRLRGRLPDMVEPAYILFGKTGGEFAFGCVTGVIYSTHLRGRRRRGFTMGRQ